MACTCGHSEEEHNPECEGTVTFEGKTEKCICVAYEEAEEKEP